MQTDPQNRWKKLKPGLLLSVALHGVLAAILFLHLPDAQVSPPEEAVPVEMVQAPPEKKPEPPAQKAPRAQAKASEPPAKSPPPPAKQPVAEKKPEPAAPPAAFESASKDGDKEPASATGSPTPEKADPQPLPSPEVLEKADAATPDAAEPTPQSQPAAADKATPPPAEVKEKPAAALPEVTLPEAHKPTEETFADPEAARTKDPTEPGPPAAVSAPQNRPEKSSISPPPVAPARTPAAKPGAASPPALKLAKAKKLYSADALSNPRLREALGTLPPDSRLVQICSIEALEQIRHGSAGHVPDLFAASSPTGRQIKGNQFQASGGAFRSNGIWYDVAFSCSADPKTYAVTSFRFVIGNAVPKSQWSARQFPRN